TKYSYFLFYYFMTHPPPRSTLFPYTTLFRSSKQALNGWRSAAQIMSGRIFRAINSGRTNGWFSCRDACAMGETRAVDCGRRTTRDRKSTRLNSSHVAISYAVFCLKKKKKKNE